MAEADCEIRLLRMNKNYLVAIMEILALVVICNGLSHADQKTIDESFDEKVYFEKGVPEKVQDLNDFARVYNTFWEIADQNKNSLPRYDSKKSGNLFNRLFNKNHIENISKKEIQLQQKIELLSKYGMMYSSFEDIYSVNNVGHIYEDEIVRLSSLKAFCIISEYKKLDEEMNKKKLKAADVFKKPEEKVLFITKMIGREFWGLNFKIEKLDIIDAETKNSIRNDIERYKKIVSSIKFLDYDANIKKIKSLY